MNGRYFVNICEILWTTNFGFPEDMTLCSSRAPFQHAALPCEAPRGATQRVEGARLPGGPRWQEGIHQTWENLGKILENVGKPWKPQFCVPAPLCGVCVFPRLPGEGLDIVLLELLPPSVLPLLRPSQQRTPDLNGHCRTSTAGRARPELRAQWALPGLNCGLQISVGTAGPQPRGPELSALPEPVLIRLFSDTWQNAHEFGVRHWLAYAVHWLAYAVHWLSTKKGW